MAVGKFTLYAANLDDLRMQDLPTATVKMALVTNSYVPNATSVGHSLWSEASPNEITAGNGYLTGGATLSADVVTAITNGHKYGSADVTWTATGGQIQAWRYAVMYVVGTLWGKTNPLIGYFIGDSTPADIPATTDGNVLALPCDPVDGWFKFVRNDAA